MDRRVIGRVDQANFPLINLIDVRVKIDTGAYTSSIHCSEIELKNNLLHCRFFDEKDHQDLPKEFIFSEYEVKVVKSSNGLSEPRYCITTDIELFGIIYPIALTLTKREAMKNPVLLGRRFLKKKFIVDTSKSNLSYIFKHKK